MRGVSSENAPKIHPPNAQETSKNIFIGFFENIKNFLWRGLGYQESDRSSSVSERYSISSDPGSISSQSTLSRIRSSITPSLSSIASMFGAKAQKNPEIKGNSPTLNWLQTPENSPSEPHLDNSPISDKTLEEGRKTDTTTETRFSSSPIEELKKKFIEKIDQYSVRGFTKNNAINDEVGTYLDANGVQKLHEGCTQSIEARQKFINFLLDQKITTSTTIDKLPIPLSKLLGKEGEKLYKAALAEEHNSASFRSAVFLASSSKRGDSLEKAQVIFLVGPSASGKSSALEAVTKKIFPETPETGEKGERKNKLISIDGAVEREISQVSHLLVTFAKHQGYQGVVGLHMSEGDKEVKSIKRCILEAVKASEKKDLSIIIPETFSRYGTGGWMGMGESEKNRLKGEGEIGKMISFAKTNGRGVVLIGIEGKDPVEFQKSVAVMGNKRAWDQMGIPAPNISPDTKLTSESKAYGAIGFRFGVNGSKAATKAFQEEIRKYKDLSAQQYKITNDLVAFKQIGNEWLKVVDVADAKKHSDSAVLISSPLAEIWENKNLESIDQKHKSEVQRFIHEKDLKGFADYCKENGLSEVNLEKVELGTGQK